MASRPAPPRWARLRAIVTYPFRLGPWAGPGERVTATPFGGLAVVHNLSSVGDALVTVALAGSVFVSVSLHAARGRTALGLLCTVLPFGVVGPFVGPVIDRLRGGRRFIVFLAAIGRVAACLMMAAWIHNLLLFPAAFLSLVCSKTHAIARAALVPTVVSSDQDLVRANSRLAVGSSILTAAAAGIGAVIYRAFGSKSLLDIDVVVFALTAALALHLLAPSGQVSPEPVGAGWPEPAGAGWPEREPAGAGSLEPVGAGWPEPAGAAWPEPEPAGAERREPNGAERREPNGAELSEPAGAERREPNRTEPLEPASLEPPAFTSPGSRARRGRQRRVPPPRNVALAQVAMTGMRAMAGFMTALVVFAFRQERAPLIWYGLVAVASVGGNLGGALIAPPLRDRVKETQLMAGAALVIAAVALAMTQVPDLHRRPAALVLALTVGLGASAAKTAFDAIVQRDAPDAERAHLFARYESIFQLGWVLAALVPTLINTSLLVGFLVVAATVLVTSTIFVVGVSRPAPAVAHWPQPVDARD